MWESTRMYWPGVQRRNSTRAKLDFKTNDLLERSGQLLVDAERQLKLSPTKEATLLFGLGDSDKTAVAVSLAGQNNALVEVEKSIKHGTSSGEKLDHLLPIMYVNTETNHTFYDMPDFKKDRIFSEDITVSNLMEKVARTCQQIKILLIVDYESCNSKSNDTNHFIDLLTYVTTFLKTSSSHELAEFVSLVVTKTPKDIEENSKTSVVQFLERISEQVKGEPNDMEKRLLQILLSPENDYGHIEVFRSPISHARDLTRLRNQVNNLTKFISTDSIVFGPTISAETFAEIKQIRLDIDEIISNEVEQVGAVLAKVYQSRVKRVADSQILRKEMQYHLTKVTQGILDMINSENPRNFFQNILLAMEGINTAMPLKHYFALRTQIEYLDWLEHLSPTNSTRTPSQWVQPLRSTFQLVRKYHEWFEFLNNLNDLFSSYTTHPENSYIRDVTKWDLDLLYKIREMRITNSNYHEFQEILVNSTNLSEVPMEVTNPKSELLEKLNKVLDQTIQSKNHYTCEQNDTLVVVGAFIKFSDVIKQENVCNRLHTIKVYGSRNVFFDTNADLAKKDLNVYIKAPTWYISSCIEVKLRGNNATSGLIKLGQFLQQDQNGWNLRSDNFIGITDSIINSNALIFRVENNGSTINSTNTLSLADVELEYKIYLNKILNNSQNIVQCKFSNEIFRFAENPSKMIMGLVDEYKILADKNNVTSDELFKFIEKVKNLKISRITQNDNQFYGEQQLLVRVQTAANSKWNTLFYEELVVGDIGEFITDLKNIMAEKDDFVAGIKIIDETDKYENVMQNECNVLMEILQSTNIQSTTEADFIKLTESIERIFNEVVKLQENTEIEIYELEKNRGELKDEMVEVIIRKSVLLIAQLMSCFGGIFAVVGTTISITLEFIRKKRSENSISWLQTLKSWNKKFEETEKLVEYLTNDKIKMLNSQFVNIHTLFDQSNDLKDDYEQFKELQGKFEEAQTAAKNGKADPKQIYEIGNELKETIETCVQKHSQGHLRNFWGSIENGWNVALEAVSVGLEVVFPGSTYLLKKLTGVAKKVVKSLGTVLNFLQIGVTVGEIIDVTSESLEAIAVFTDGINEKRLLLNKLEEIEKEICGEIFPMFETIRETFKRIETNRSPQDVIPELVNLDFPQKMLQLKSTVSKICEETDIKHDYIEDFKKFDFSMRLFLGMFELIQKVKLERDNVKSILEINEQQTKLQATNITDTKIRKAIYEMEEAIRINRIIHKYNSAINSVKIAVFPNAEKYFRSFQLSSSDRSNSRQFARQAIEQMETFHSQLLVAQKHHRQQASNFFLSEDDPVYEWNDKLYRSEIDQLLSGKKVYLKADASTNFNKNVVKIKQVELNLALKENSQNITRETMSKVLAQFNYHLKHLGFSQYRCGNRIYTMKHQEMHIVQSFAKNESSDRPLYYNEDSSIINNSSLISPYTFWEIRLENRQNSNSTDFSSLKKLIGMVDLLLLGSGNYLDLDAEICDQNIDTLDKFYTPDYTLGEIFQDDIDKMRSEKVGVGKPRSAYPQIMMRHESPTDSKNFECRQSQPSRVPRSFKKFPDLIVNDRDYTDEKMHKPYLATSSASKTHSPSINTFINAVLQQFIIIEFLNYFRQAKDCFVNYFTPIFQHEEGIENSTFFKYEKNFESLAHEKIESVYNDFRLNARQYYDMVDNALLLAPIAVNYIQRFLGSKKSRPPTATKSNQSENLELAIISSYVNSVIKRGEILYGSQNNLE